MLTSSIPVLLLVRVIVAPTVTAAPFLDGRVDATISSRFMFLAWLARRKLTPARTWWNLLVTVLPGRSISIGCPPLSEVLTGMELREDV